MSDLATLIMDQLVDAITADCQTAIAEDDTARLRLIKKGRFQDDPTDFSPLACVHRNDPVRTENVGAAGWADEILETEIGMTIGGPAFEHWYRRFTVEIQVWPAGEYQDEAEVISGIVTARVRRAVNSLIITNLADEFGESIVVGYNPIRKIKTDEGGGPDDEYAWKTYLYLEYLTLWQPS